MAASSPGQDVQDPGYRNCLKVGLALWYMKKALESIIKDEVNSMHELLTKKIYGGTTLPYPNCERCQASDITQNKDRVWEFGGKSACQVGCHVWFNELLQLFDNPHSDRIYWSNCDVTSWAYIPWECAKAFMPRGQDQNNTDPSESDNQALLTLMANCKHFHKLLTPKGLKQTYKVSNVRNKTMHAPQMALTDEEMNDYIQEIIFLLEDSRRLRHISACVAAVSDIKKIRDASLDVYLDQEKAMGELIDKALGKLEKKIDSQQRQINQVERRCDSRHGQMGPKVRKLTKEMADIKKKTRGPMQPTEKDVRDIQLLFIKAYESVQIISINPVFDTAVYWKDLEDFYTDIVIEEKQEGSAQRRTDKQQVDKEKVMSFRQVFKKGDKKVTRIILKAPAGQGKSTFCRKLVHTWCSVQKKELNIPIDAGISDESETSGLKHEDVMLRFDVLLYICLRYISDDENTLMDVLYTQFPLHESQDLSHKSHIEALIGQAEENKVLLIMDGLDEMNNTSPFIEKIMQRRLYPHITVLATTRPWKIDQLCLIKSAHIDLLLDLQGFSYENSMLYAKRIFDKYYTDESAIEQFKKDIRKNSVIQSLVHIPLLLLFIVHVWHENKSFPQTIHELYMEILNVMVNRYMEGKEWKEKSKGRQVEKKYLLPLESMTFSVTPKLRTLSLVHHFGEGFLAALCEVANHFCITHAKETSLVFKEKDLVELLGKDGFSKLQTALDLGILSKSESPGILRKEICLTFLHKTVQEFLAAINICCGEDKCDIFLDSLNTINDVFQNEKIIMFVAGISTIHYQKISEKIYEICDKNRIGRDGVPVLSRLYIDCFREVCGEPVNLKLYCVYGNNQEDWNVLPSALWSASNVRTHLKYLILNQCDLDDVTLDLSEFNCLEYLVLRDVTMKGKLLLSKCTWLKHLELTKCRLDGATLDVAESHCLKYFILEEVTMKGKLLLSKCTQLKHLELTDCSLDGATLDLSESNCLTYLVLRYVTMKGKLFLSKCTQLKCLGLQKCSLDDATLDLSESNCLKYLILQHVTMKCKLLLSKCTRLKHLRMQKCSLDDVTLDLAEFHCLKYFFLEDVTMEGKVVDLGDGLLSLDTMNELKEFTLENVTMSKECKDVLCNSLSQCKELRTLSIKNGDLCDALLRLDNINKLWAFTLENVTMSKECTEVLCNILSQCKELWRLSIKNVDLCDALLRLDNINKLWAFTLENVTMSKECKEVLCNSLTQCKELRRLSIKNVDLCDALLSLDSVNKLYEFTLENVTMSKECTEVLCNSLSQCKELSTLSIKNVDLCDALLSLYSVNKLDGFTLEFTLENVTMSKECTEVLCHSLSQCKILWTLSIKNVVLCDALLSLDSADRLIKLDLDNVTMTKDSKRMLFKSLSKSESLSLSIANMDLHVDDELLRFFNLHSLCMLELDNATNSIENQMSLFVVLSHFEKLKYLSLKNLDQSDGLHELYNMNRLSNITLDNVKMGKTSKVLMCKSLSQCTKLYVLKLKNLDLGDGLLSLNNLEMLNSLVINNVTMCKDGYVILCNSISSCTQLKYLKLMNLNLGDAKPSLNNLDELELVNITISLQYVDDIKSSVQHLKSLHHYSSECTRELIIEKAADICEKCVVNYTNKRVEDDDEVNYDFYDNDDDDKSDAQVNYDTYDDDDDDDDDDDEDDDDDFYDDDDDDDDNF